MRLVLLSVMLALGLCGCARTYVITLQNGRKITTASKPHLKDGSYVFKDAQGRPAYVSASRVREVSPASMSSGQTGRSFKEGPLQQ